MGAIHQIYEGLRSFIQVPAGKEQRRLVRVICDYEAHCKTESYDGPGRVTDLGLNGLRLELPVRLPNATRIAVSLLAVPNEPADQRQQVAGSVRWCRRKKEAEAYQLGVVFREDARLTPGSLSQPDTSPSISWAKALLKDLGFDETALFSRRKRLRIGATVPAELLGSDGSTHTGEVVNLGVGGCLLRLASNPDPTAEYDVRLGPTHLFRVLYVRAIVKQSHQEPELGHHMVGLELKEMKPAQTRLLGDYVLSLLKS
jgi:hypothetical protein